MNRRNFLKTGSLSLAGLILSPLLPQVALKQPGENPEPSMLGRVTRGSIKVHAEPEIDSPIIGKLLRDEVVDLLESLESPHSPAHNPRWYRVEEGYIHSAYVQRVKNIPSTNILKSIPKSGILGQVTVPVSQSFLRNRQGYWVKLYRLYYSSVHWITGVGESPEGKLLYRLTDEWLRVSFFVPAETIEPLSLENYSPLLTDIPPGEKRVEVALQDQTMTAYEGNEVVLHSLVSTGVRYMETPIGDHLVQRKFPSKHMGNGGLTSDPRAYELIGVPWTTFFHDAGIAFHGTFWHDNFGTPMSHGCVNIPNQAALWLFRWTSPPYTLEEGEKQLWKVSAKQGTRVIVK